MCTSGPADRALAGVDPMLLAYAAGFALVPGAIVGIALALWKPSSREESGFAALLVGLLLGLFAETALYATNGSDRFQERYLMVLLPLVFPAFVLWLRRGRPAKARGRAHRASGCSPCPRACRCRATRSATSSRTRRS